MKVWIGSHVGNSGKLMLEGSVLEALSYNANALMVYLGAPQNSYRKPLSELNIPNMLTLMESSGISNDSLIIHAPYIVNLATYDDEKRNFGIDFITKELMGVKATKARCLVLHPGSAVNVSREEGIVNIANSLKQILENTKDDETIIALETMAGKGNELARTFEEINQIIKLVDSPRIMVCLDTCHIFDGGYDIVNDYDGVINEFDRIVGLEKLSVIHLNDSKNIQGSHKDRHENFGFGNIGFNTLLKFVYDERFANIPKILETPYVDKEYAPYKYEIEMIKNKEFDSELLEKIKNKL